MTDDIESTSPAVEATAEGADGSGPEPERRKLSVFEKGVVALCGIGVIAAVIIALEYSGISIVGHTVDVLSETWTQEATVGVVVALIVAVIVAFFIWLLARATVDNPADEPIEEAYTTEMLPE